MGYPRQLVQEHAPPAAHQLEERYSGFAPHAVPAVVAAPDVAAVAGGRRWLQRR